MKSILDPAVHERLIQDIQSVALQARVPVHMIHQSAVPFLTAEELEYVKHIRQHAAEGVAGLCLTGKTDPGPANKMMAMAAAMLRNFIDARVCTLLDIAPKGEKAVPEDPEVLLLPNFYDSYDGKPMASWQLQVLHSTLTKRFIEAKQTILYVQNMDKMTEHYGEGLASLIRDNYKILKG